MSTADSRKAYRQANPDKVKAQIAAWRKANPGKAKEYAAKRYALKSAEILAAARGRRAADPDTYRAHSRRSKYRKEGVDFVAAEAARAAHDGRCDCCGKDKPGGKGTWNMDHDHESGQVRGILCFQCNVGIGRLGDTLNGVMRAVSYLQRAERRKL